ncbi:MAG: cytochrome D1 domain-containing protein [Acidobacteriota bacterium]|nr:cytochrome D1 domain-containing protein [Acidobacteriota bacterium]
MPDARPSHCNRPCSGSLLAPDRLALTLAMMLAVLLSWVPVLPAAGAEAQTLLVANKSDHTVDLMDLASGESRATLPTGHAPHEITVSPDGQRAVISNYGDREKAGNSLTVVDVGTAKVLSTVELGEHTRPHGLAWIDTDTVVVTTEGSGRLLTVDVKQGKILQEVATGHQVSHMVAVSPATEGGAGDRAFVSSIGSGKLAVIDLAKGEKIADLATGEGAEGLAVSPDGKEVWIGNRAADTLTVLDATSLEILATVPCPGFPIRVTFTPDGKHLLVSAARTGEVAVFDVAARKELRRGPLDLTNAPDAARRLFGDQFGSSPVPVGLVVDPDGSRAWVAATQADAVVVIDPETLEVQDLLRAGREPDGMAWSSVRAPAAEESEEIQDGTEESR